MKKQWLISLLLIALPGIGGGALAAEQFHDHGATRASASQSIAATGTVRGVDAAGGKLAIDHDPIPALKWPRMVMDFRLADKTLVGKVKVGDRVKFELRESEKGAYLITVIEVVP